MKKITLIIGAGANKEINSTIDLGSELIKNISDRVTDRTSPADKYFSNLLNQINFVPNVREEFVKALDSYINEVSSPSIDAFLDEVENYPEFQIYRESFLRIGRIAIIFHVMGYEGKSTKDNIENDLKKKETWMSILCDFIQNKLFINQPEIDLSIVTFNYDRILEYYLLKWFDASEEIRDFINTKINHVYGRIGCLKNLKTLDKDEKNIEFGLGPSFSLALFYSAAVASRA